MTSMSRVQYTAAAATPWLRLAALQRHLQRRQPRHPGLHALPPGLADASVGAAAAGSSPLMDSLPAGLQQGLGLHPQLYILEGLVVLASAYAAAAWPDRPRGWCLSALVAVSWRGQACGAHTSLHALLALVGPPCCSEVHACPHLLPPAATCLCNRWDPPRWRAGACLHGCTSRRGPSLASTRGGRARR